MSSILKVKEPQFGHPCYKSTGFLDICGCGCRHEFLFSVFVDADVKHKADIWSGSWFLNIRRYLFSLFADADVKNNVDICGSGNPVHLYIKHTKMEMWIYLPNAMKAFNII